MVILNKIIIIIMKKEKCEMCGKLVDKNKIDEHHINKKENPNKKIKVCKDCHFKIHRGEKKKTKQVFSDGVVEIPKKILFDKTISSSAKILYGVLINTIGENKHCLINNQDISEIMGITKTQASRLFSQLEKYLIVKDRTMPKRKISLIK